MSIQDVVTLRSNVGGWNPITYESFSDTGIYSWTLTSEAIAAAGIAANKHVDFKLFSGNTWYGNDGKEASEDWQGFTYTGGGNAYIVYDPEYTSYSIQAMYKDNKWRVRVVENIDNHDYYWVSPQVTNGQKLESCKLTALRNRSRDGDGKLGDGKITTAISPTPSRTTTSGNTTVSALTKAKR